MSLSLCRTRACLLNVRHIHGIHVDEGLALNSGHPYLIPRLLNLNLGMNWL